MLRLLTPRDAATRSRVLNACYGRVRATHGVVVLCGGAVETPVPPRGQVVLATGASGHVVDVRECVRDGLIGVHGVALLA